MDRFQPFDDEEKTPVERLGEDLYSIFKRWGRFATAKPTAKLAEEFKKANADLQAIESAKEELRLRESAILAKKASLEDRVDFIEVEHEILAEQARVESEFRADIETQYELRNDEQKKKERASETFNAEASGERKKANAVTTCVIISGYAIGAVGLYFLIARHHLG